MLYQIIGGPVKYQGRLWQDGETVEMEEAVAASLLSGGVIEEATPLAFDVGQPAELVADEGPDSVEEPPAEEEPPIEQETATGEEQAPVEAPKPRPASARTRKAAQ